MLPQNLKYVKSHEWLQALDDQTVKIGITHHAQKRLGDITFVELPDPGLTLQKDEPFGTIESVKAASDLYMPVTGTILTINEQLEEYPERLNASPYENGWMIKVKLHNPKELDASLSKEEYQQLI